MVSERKDSICSVLSPQRTRNSINMDRQKRFSLFDQIDNKAEEVFRFEQNNNEQQSDFKSKFGGSELDETQLENIGKEEDSQVMSKVLYSVNKFGEEDMQSKPKVTNSIHKQVIQITVEPLTTKEPQPKKQNFEPLTQPMDQLKAVLIPPLQLSAVLDQSQSNEQLNQAVVISKKPKKKRRLRPEYNQEEAEAFNNMMNSITDLRKPRAENINRA